MPNPGLFKHCEISGVFNRLSTERVAYNEIMIEIKVFSENHRLPTYRYVQMSQKYGLYEELIDLKSGQREYVYGDYHMQNIDISYDRHEEVYILNHSPLDGISDIFIFNKQDFEENFISALAPDNCKDPGGLHE